MAGTCNRLKLFIIQQQLLHMVIRIYRGSTQYLSANNILLCIMRFRQTIFAIFLAYWRWCLFMTLKCLFSTSINILVTIKSTLHWSKAKLFYCFAVNYNVCCVINFFLLLLHYSWNQSSDDDRYTRFIKFYGNNIVACNLLKWVYEIKNQWVGIWVNLLMVL